MTDLNLRALRVQRRSIFAVGIAVAIAVVAFMLSFAVLREFALQDGIPHSLAWIFPPIVDSAMLSATIAVVALRTINRNGIATATRPVGSAQLSPGTIR
ncbi:DUF2637 domain-containing protein (plasmid) [Rhodococcus pseudokoreensis]|uniref:DUF2637 domain-containing protein n=1 Tax=Rhodococcus pseudokoreensis TaxID=2811421 RepID=A0A974ZRZ4_9NOCA|nr:DUF2637 domain-containing protein [Rhodococcus pseudokoreensis]